MSGPLRSKQGCWTCRLRKKKCDEGRPLCSLCTSLSITCYGYGPRPDWMDNGEREKAVANGIKEIVKHTSRRKITTQLSSRQQDHVIRIAPNPSNVPLGSSSSGAISNRQHDTPPPSDHGSSQEGGIQEVQDASNVSIFTRSSFNQF
jgi:C6 transcription factor Pro1